MASSGKSPGSSAGSLPGSFRKLWNQTSWSSTNDGNGSAQSPQSQSQAHSQSEIIGSGSRTPRQGQRQGQGAPWGKTRVGGRSGRMGLGPGEREGGGEGDGEGAGDGESQDLVQLMMQLEDDTHHQARELHAQLAREVSRREALTEENDHLRRALRDQSGDITSAYLARLERQLQEAQGARALAEDKVLALTMELEDAQGILEGGEGPVDPRQPLGRRRAPPAQQQQQEMQRMKAEHQSLEQKVRELQDTLEEVRRESANREAEMQQKLQQLRADARRHQATILEKGNEIGALHQQLSERNEASQAAVRMNLDLTVLRRTNQRLEEELRSREQEIAALKALGSTAEGQGADGGGKGKGEEGSAEKGVADGKPQEGEGPEDGGKGKGQGAKGATPRALQASGSSSQLAVSTLSADDLDELQRSYDKQLQSTEKELERLRADVVRKEAEAGALIREFEDTKAQNSELKAELEALRRRAKQGQEEERAKVESLEGLLEDLQGELLHKDHQVQQHMEENLELRKKLKQQQHHQEEVHRAAIAAESEAGAAAAAQQHQHPPAQAGWEEELEEATRLHNEEVARFQQALERSEKELLEVQLELRRARGEVGRARDALAAAELEKQSLQQELAVQQSLLEAANRDLVDAAARLRQREQSLTESYNQSQDYLHEAWEDLQKAQEEVEAHRRDETELRVRVEELEQELASLQASEAGRGGVGDLDLDMQYEEAVRGAKEEVAQELEALEGTVKQQAEELEERQQQLVQARQRSAQQDQQVEDLSKALAEEVEKHAKTKQDLDRDKEELKTERRVRQSLEEFNNAALSISVPDLRDGKSGHTLTPRPKTSFGCSQCRRVRHNLQWRCQKKLCSDVLCTECFSSAFS